jgi:hypothetical protein
MRYTLTASTPGYAMTTSSRFEAAGSPSKAACTSRINSPRISGRRLKKISASSCARDAQPANSGNAASRSRP